MLHQKYWGKGLASELVKNLLDYAFNKTATTEVIAFTHLLNLASQRVLEKAGFKRQEAVLKDGEELALFMLLKSPQ